MNELGEVLIDLALIVKNIKERLIVLENKVDDIHRNTVSRNQALLNAFERSEQPQGSQPSKGGEK